MACVYAPRVKETTETTGTGTYSLAGAASGFQSFVAGIGNTNTTCYCCTDGTNWEVGYGTLTAGTPNTLARTAILASSNSESAVSWSSGSKEIFCTFPYRMLRVIQGDISAFGNFTIDQDAPGLQSIKIGYGLVCSGEHSYVFGQDSNCIGGYSTLIGMNNYASTNGNILIGNNNVGSSSNAPAYCFGEGAYVVTALDPIIGYATSYDWANKLLGRLQTAYAETTNATEAGMSLTLAPALDTTATIAYQILLVARQTGGTSGSVGDSKAWKLDLLVKYSSGTPTRIGSTSASVIEADSNASAWAFAVNFSETYPLRITGAANKTIRWVATVSGIEVCDYS